MSDQDDRAAVRERLLLATLPHVAFDGWTEAVLMAGAKDCGWDATAVLRYFPGGPPEMVRLFSDWADARIAVEGESGARTHERVKAAVMARLAASTPYREAARRTFAFLALPPHATLGLACLYRTVNTIWYAAGDRSADFSFYTKRALLAGVYTTTMIYWFDDKSEDAADTRAFLDRRLADVMRLHRVRGDVDRFLRSLSDPRSRRRRA